MELPSRDLRVVYALSDVLLAQRRQPEVVVLWRQAVARNPKSIPLQRGLAKALYLAGNYEQAIAHYRAILSGGGADVEATAMLAVSLYAGGAREEAMALFKKASEMAGANQTMIEGLMAYLYQVDANGAAAEFFYRRVLAREPGNHTVLNNLAYYLAEKGSSLDEAARLAANAVAIQKENLDYQDTLAYVSLRAGKAQEAAEKLNSLVKMVPGNPSYRFHLGLALVQLGRKEDARQEFAAALARSPDPSLAARIKQAVTQL
jgi:Flp pilus assembly protein TadD